MSLTFSRHFRNWKKLISFRRLLWFECLTDIDYNWVWKIYFFFFGFPAVCLSRRRFLHSRRHAFNFRNEKKIENVLCLVRFEEKGGIISSRISPVDMPFLWIKLRKNYSKTNNIDENKLKNFCSSLIYKQKSQNSYQQNFIKIRHQNPYNLTTRLDQSKIL